MHARERTVRFVRLVGLAVPVGIQCCRAEFGSRGSGWGYPSAGARRGCGVVVVCVWGTRWGGAPPRSAMPGSETDKSNWLQRLRQITCRVVVWDSYPTRHGLPHCRHMRYRQERAARWRGEAMGWVGLVWFGLSTNCHGVGALVREYRCDGTGRVSGLSWLHAHLHQVEHASEERMVCRHGRPLDQCIRIVCEIISATYARPHALGG